jgi:hypothetical protein
VQNEPAPEAASRPGVTVLLDIIVAPARAFATIAARRPVLLAICVAVACTIAATFLTLPAQLHIGGIKVIGPAERLNIATYVLLQLVLLIYSWSVIASIFSNIAGGEPAQYWTRYRTFFSLAANAAIPSQLGSLAQGIAVRLHPPESYHSLAQIANALPFSLAIFATPGNPREVAFLSSFDVTTIWSIVLVAFGAHAIGKIKLVPAVVVPCAIALAIAFIGLFIP